MTLIFVDGLPTGFDVTQSVVDVKRALGWHGADLPPEQDPDYRAHVDFILSSGEPITLSRWHVRVVIDGSTE